MPFANRERLREKKESREKYREILNGKKGLEASPLHNFAIRGSWLQHLGAKVVEHVDN